MPHGPVSPDPGRDEDPARRPGEPGEPPQDGPGRGEPDLPDDASEGWRELPPSHKDWLTEEEWVARVSSEEAEEWFGPGEDPEDDLSSGAPAGFAGRINLTTPLATLLGLAERLGEISGIGPIDPDPGANTWDRYQTGHQPIPVSSTSTYPTAAPAGRKLVCVTSTTRGSNRLKDDRQMRAARHIIRLWQPAVAAGVILPRMLGLLR